MKPKNDGDEVLYQGSVKMSAGDEQGKKSKEKYVVLKGDYKVEIHDSTEVNQHRINPFSCLHRI